MTLETHTSALPLACLCVCRGHARPAVDDASVSAGGGGKHERHDGIQQHVSGADATAAWREELAFFFFFFLWLNADEDAAFRLDETGRWARQPNNQTNVSIGPFLI